MTFEEMLEQNGFITYTNVGTSMLPLLREHRDIMMIRRRGEQRLKKLDAVLFVRPHVEGRGRYVVHRILRVCEDGYWIVGDNCVSGEHVKEDQVIGILTGVIRDGKKVRFDSLRYRMYVCLWCAPYHLRFALLRTKRFVRRAGSFVKRRILRIR